jgi:hypothetical protein
MIGYTGASGRRQISMRFAASLLAPAGGVMGLADGLFWDLASPHVAAFTVTPEPKAVAALPREFHNAEFLALTPASISALRSLTTAYGTGSLFIFFVLFTPTGSVLEWYDAPADPMSIAPTIPRATVMAFAQALGLPVPTDP